MFNKFGGKKGIQLRDAYLKCFCDEFGNLTLSGQLIINDLLDFCNVRTTTAIVNSMGELDALRLALEEGRRTVYNRINYYLTLSEAEIQKARLAQSQLEEVY